MKVIGIGDNVCDKYIHLNTMFPGGQALNFAVYAKMLGADSSYMGTFGRDAVADHILVTLDELEVKHDHCRQYDGENGYARVTLVDGDRVFLGSNKGGIAKEYPVVLDTDNMEYVKQFSHIHTSNNSYFDSQLPKLAEAGLSVSYDFSGQWTDQEKVAQVVPYIKYAFLSCGSVQEEEAEEICYRIYKAGCPMVIATRGSYGSVLYDGKKFHKQAPKLVEAVDTLGAGDSFATAFLLSYVGNLEKNTEQYPGKTNELTEIFIKEAMAAGAEFAAKTCMVQGAFGHGKEIQ
ncbi:MAG: fructoselysine 6-kinase [Clostridium sp.]|jgi:fructoselysine 6-kinase|nr:fructoselysine 6-kinase [Clostridium sp.]